MREHKIRKSLINQWPSWHWIQDAKKKLENMKMSSQYDIKEKCKNYWKLEKSRLGHAYVY